MSRILVTASLAALLAACTASSDDVGAVGEDDAVGVAEMVNECPNDLVLDLDEYSTEVLPAFNGDYPAWHLANSQRDGVETTDTGAQYRVIQSGMENGMQPRSGEEVITKYHGYKLDGTVFDSSYEREETFITETTRVISGWTEMLEGMTICEARTIYLPANLAYGDRGAGGAIAPGETLVFNMQLLRVNRAEADPIGIAD